MVADVSGKGTSAALYMAELKGLMLALTRRRVAARAADRSQPPAGHHLDNRNFITMTYASSTCGRAR
jgi:serine phosphatase RsbU (regulator of sigma subunit)